MLLNEAKDLFHFALANNGSLCHGASLSYIILK